MSIITDILLAAQGTGLFKITDRQLDMFESYSELLIRRNEEINLTAIVEPQEIAVKHLLDSISPLWELSIKEGANIIDVGTGAGFPGIPLKVMRDDLKMTLLDSSAKRTGFLKEACSLLGIDDVEIVTARAEELGRDEKYRESFDFCVTRAVAKLPVLLELCAPFVKVGGSVVCLKGKNISQELAMCKDTFSRLSLKIPELLEAKIPQSDLSHTILTAQKGNKIKDIYPRNYSRIIKSPL